MTGIGKIHSGFRDSELSEEEYKETQARTIKAIRKKLVVRQIMPWAFREPVGWANEFEYFTETDLSDAQMDTIFRSLNTDTYHKASSSIAMMKIEKDFFVERWKLERGREVGRNLVAEAAEMASYKVAKLENEFILKGWAEDGSNYDVDGLYEKAGNDYSTSKDFGTYGNPLAATQGAIALLLADDEYGPYNMFLNPVQANELSASKSSTGVPELEMVNRVLNSSGFGKLAEPNESTNRIFSASYITAGTGMLISEDDQEAIAVVPGVPLTVETYDSQDGKGVSGRVFETLGLVVARTNAISKMSDI